MMGGETGMAKTFILSIENLKQDSDIKVIKDYFDLNLKGIEDVQLSLSMGIATVRYNEGVGSPKLILDAFNKIGYPVR